MHIEYSVGGFLVGLLVGMTGMGGGLVMTPMMIFLFHISPAIAIGTDLIYASITKMFGSWQHYRQKTIDFAAVRYLSIGSVPGALAGVGLLSIIRYLTDMTTVNHLMEKALGITYLLIAVIMIWRLLNRKYHRVQHAEPELPKKKLILLGIFGGMIVGVTSVGSGTLFIAILTMIYPIASSKLVGTDITQAIMVTGVAGLANLAIGTVNLTLLFSLLIGSIPGILIGSRLTMKVPDQAIRTLLSVMLFLSGIKFLN